jgi:nitrogen regulatory protein P-II 2
MKQLVPIKMITIIALDSLQNRLLEDLRKCGMKGYTIVEVEGEGLQAKHFTDWEGRNIRIETLVSDEKVLSIMEMLSQNYFEKYGVIAFVTTVEVLRKERFD